MADNDTDYAAIHPRCDKCEQVMILNCTPRGDRHFWECEGCGVTAEASPEAVAIKEQQIVELMGQLHSEDEQVQLCVAAAAEEDLLRHLVKHLSGTDPDHAAEEVWWRAEALLEYMKEHPEETLRSLDELPS